MRFVNAFAVAVSSLALPAAACDAPAKLLGDGAAIAEVRPRIHWSPVDGADKYRIRLQSRVPEGKVMAAADTVLDRPAFLPPQPLAERRAKVTLRVKAICGKEESLETVSWFLIDTSAGCRMGEVKVSGKEIAWEPVMGAKSYEVRRYSLADGRLLQSIETKETRAALVKTGAVIGVRPLCAGGLGEAVYRVVAR